MPKKKRLKLIVLVLLGVGIGWLTDFFWFFAALGALAGILGGAYAFRRAIAHWGIERLRAYQPQYNYGALADAARAQTPDPQNFTFVVLGDNRCVQEIAKQVYGAAMGENPSFLFNTGDIVRYGRPCEYFEHHLPLIEACAPAPVICIPGNHERTARRDFGPYKALYGGDSFAFDLGPCRFVGFNNGKRPRVNAGDVAFVARELAREPQPPHVFLFYHVPPRFFEERIVVAHKRRGFKEHAEDLHDLCVRHSVAEVFMGHFHGYASHVIDGVRYTLTAGAGSPLSTRLRPEHRFHNYLVRRISPAGVRRETVGLKEGAWTRIEEPGAAP